MQVTTDVSFDLAECLERVRQGDELAARALVEELYPQVIRIVRSHLPQRLAEEDLAQEIFAKIFARLGQYQVRADVPFAHWVSRLAVRTCLDALRAERRRPELRWSDLDEAEAAWLSYMVAEEPVVPETSAESASAVVHRLLEQLPPADRLVLTLLDLEQKSTREISELTGWSVTLVKVRAFRARRRLRKLAEKLEIAYEHV